MSTLHLQVNQGPSISIKEDCSLANNLAWIDLLNQTCLNFKSENADYIIEERYLIRDIFERKGINIVGLGNWQNSDHGQTASGQGTGYQGWLKFNNLEEAKKFLEQECGYTLVYCNQ
jgi:hypothetical protein